MVSIPTLSAADLERIACPRIVAFIALSIALFVGCSPTADIGDAPEDCADNEVLILAHRQGHPTQPHGDLADDARYHCAEGCDQVGTCEGDRYCRRYQMGHCWGCEQPVQAWRSRQPFEVCNDAGVIQHIDAGY